MDLSSLSSHKSLSEINEESEKIKRTINNELFRLTKTQSLQLHKNIITQLKNESSKLDPDSQLRAIIGVSIFTCNH